MTLSGIRPSARAFWLWGGLALLFVAAWIVPALVWVALGLDLVVAVLVVVDGWDARSRRVELVRTLPPTVYQGEPTLLTVAVTNPSARPLGVRLREVLPAALAEESVELLLNVPPMSTVTQSVPLVPRLREHATLTTAAVRLAGRWGLAWAERRLGEPVAVKVYPKVHHEGETGMVLRQALERRDGAHARNLHGPSTEVASLRDYQPGDDFRAVQWKATARRGKPVTAERTWEQRQRLALSLIHI